ncbi:hypothetical protein B0H11DRAFT_2251634 [Mycena galericulata]|nr:hypothetical protein B0H11DRAFT_2251634 [Mycena galericulata]
MPLTLPKTRLCENGSQHNISKCFGKCPESLVAVYISQVLAIEGLMYLHDQRVIRRDIFTNKARKWTYAAGATLRHATSRSAGFGLVAGTGVDKDLVEEAMNSSIAKLMPTHLTSLTGAFDPDADPGFHQRYVRRYIPQEYLNTAEGDRLLHRINTWCAGRFRLTATFLTQLLKSDFKNLTTTRGSYLPTRPTSLQVLHQKAKYGFYLNLCINK